MVRAGLASKWKCAFANDLDPMKVEVYTNNWGSAQLVVKDIHALSAGDLPGRADLAWASFPCQDLSCAGNGLGLGDERGTLKTRSGTFWPFIGLIRELKDKRRAPKIIVVENVVGLLTADNGSAFQSVARAFASLDYRFGAIIVDARWFVPQSRPRVFIIAVAPGVKIPADILASGPKDTWHPEAVIRSWRNLRPTVSKKWIWFDPGRAPKLRKTLADVVSDTTADAHWHTKRETNRLISLMSAINRKKLRTAKRLGRRMVASIFLRMRPNGKVNRQCAEVSFEDISGCLRTPKGGGSRPRVLVVRGTKVKSRLLSPREAAKLMGLRKSYELPAQYDAAFRVIGDGVAVPAVRFLRTRILEHILMESKAPKRRRKPSTSEKFESNRRRYAAIDGPEARV